MKLLAFFKNKIVLSFLAAYLVSYYLYIVLQQGRLMPVPIYLKPCFFNGQVASSLCNYPDNSSLLALYVNIISVWFIFFFFYICFTLYEILMDYWRSQKKK